MDIQETLKALGKAISISAAIKAAIEGAEELLAQLPAGDKGAAQFLWRDLENALAANLKVRNILHHQLDRLDNQEAEKLAGEHTHDDYGITKYHHDCPACTESSKDVEWAKHAYTTAHQIRNIEDVEDE